MTTRQTDKDEISKVTGDFIDWFKSSTNEERDFAIAMMIANLGDNTLERIKLLSVQYAAYAIPIVKRLKEIKNETI